MSLLLAAGNVYTLTAEAGSLTILPPAACNIVDLDGNSLTYGHHERLYLNPEFLASGL